MGLSWVDEGVYDICGLLDNIVLPALQVLAICDYRMYSDVTQPHVSSFLDRSSCNLQHLTLQINWTDHDFIMLLQGLPSLVEVVIDEAGLEMVTEQVFRRMTYDASRSLPGSHVLVPKLKRLTFSAQLAFDHKVILDMVQSRRGHPVLFHGNSSVDNQSHQVETLEFISLDFRPTQPEPEAIAEMVSMEERGLEVHIMTFGRPVLHVW
jgi:hypothetical protein